MNYRYLGKVKTLSFGVWPEVSLADARDKRDKAREQIKEGFDPNAQKKLARVRAEIDAAITFKAVAEEWLVKIEREGRAAVLMGRLSNSLYGAEVIRRYYHNIANAYLQEMLRALPDINPEGVAIGFMGMVSLMPFVCAGTGRLEALTSTIDGTIHEEKGIEYIVDFCVSGFNGLKAA